MEAVIMFAAWWLFWWCHGGGQRIWADISCQEISYERCTILPVIRPKSRWWIPSFRHESVRKLAYVTSWKPFCDLLWYCTLSSMLCSIPLSSPGTDKEQRRWSWWQWIKEAVIWILWEGFIVYSSTKCGSELSETSSWFYEETIIFWSNLPQFNFL